MYIPAELRDKIPPLYGSEGKSDAVAWVKLFTPDSSWTWYILEASAVMKDGQYRTLKDSSEHVVFAGESTEVANVVCFGLVVGHDVELGYFSLAEIASTRGPLGLPVERDLFFQPVPLSEVRAKHERRQG